MRTTDPRPRTRAIVAGVVLISAVPLAATAALDSWYGPGRTFEQLPWVKWPLILFNVGREQTLGAWLTAAVLAAGGITLLLCAGMRAAGTNRGWTAVLPALGGLALLGLSFDELSAIHERLASDHPTEASTAFASPTLFVMPLIALTALVLLIWRQLRRKLASGTALAFWSAIGVLSFIPLLEAVETTQYAPAMRPLWLLLVEEGLELLGAWLLLAGSLMHLRSLRNDGASRQVRQHLRQRWWLYFNVAGVLGAVGTQASLSRYGDYAGDPQFGLPQWWFGSVAAAALAFAAFGARHLSPQTARALTAIGWLALALSVSYGIDAFSWLTVADPSFDRVARVALAVGLGICALWLARTWRLAGLSTLAVAVALGLGQAAASAWEVAALWAAAALVVEAAMLRAPKLPAPAVPVVIRSVIEPAQEVAPRVPAAVSTGPPATSRPNTPPPAKRKKKSSRKSKPHGRR